MLGAVGKVPLADAIDIIRSIFGHTRNILMMGTIAIGFSIIQCIFNYGDFSISRSNHTVGSPIQRYYSRDLGIYLLREDFRITD